MNLVYFGEDHSDRIPPNLHGFPPDLVDLVLSAPSTGLISARIKSYARRNKEQRKIHPVTLLKQIRRLCIESRLLFWPGLSTKLEPIPCIPYGENDWKLGENGRIMSKHDLVAYLAYMGLSVGSRYLQLWQDQSKHSGRGIGLYLMLLTVDASRYAHLHHLISIIQKADYETS